ncbi:MAG: hypothetical protein JXR86_15075 [Spirochaetales bacterium]|nr:hypothetical protein [Spirochaetales bacterium]
MNSTTISMEKVRTLDERIFQELLRLNCSLLCINEARGKKRTISLRALYDNDREFWLRESSDWTYYVDSHLISHIDEGLQAVDLELEKRLTVNEESIEAKISGEYSHLKDIPPGERINALRETLARINRLIGSRSSSEQEKRDVLVEASYYAWLVNKITLDEVSGLSDRDARSATGEVARLTENIVGALTDVLSEDDAPYTFMHSLMDKSNGSTVRHMVRTFLMAHRFVLFFNRQMNDEGLASRLRVDFSGKYRKWYASLLPDIPESSLTLEHVFKGGIRPVGQQELKIYSAGFLLHDIGKQRYISYFEGDESYDGRKVEAHAKTGYRMLLQKSVYSRKIAAIAGFHHEYYGHKSGYGYYRELKALMELDQRAHRHDSCISYNLEDLNRFATLAYLPVKFLEIVDVFDAVTDPVRTYKSYMGTAQALKFIRTEFIDNNKKLDIILFDLFVRFMASERPVV